MCLWQLDPETVLPALEELSVCLLLKRSHEPKWTAFVYKALGNSSIELGLQGKGDDLSVWLFGIEHEVKKKLNLNEWHSVCITWSGRKQQLHLNINKTCHSEISVGAATPSHLSPNGTLTLGQSHFVSESGVQPESGQTLFGYISRFRIWAKKWSDEELQRQECTDGDVLSWDLRHWKSDCSPLTEGNLQCEWSVYKVTMKIFVEMKNNADEKCIHTAIQNVTNHWLDSIFPSNISVYDLTVSSSHPCPVNNSTALHGRQESQMLMKTICSTCSLIKFYVNVEPAADVEMVQMDITMRLTSLYSLDLLNLTADPDSIQVLSMDSYSAVTDSPPTVNTASLPEVGPTQSIPAYPNMTEEPLDVNKTFDKPYIFFRVNLVLSIRGSLSNPQHFITAWVNDRLDLTVTMKVLNLLITEHQNRNKVQSSELSTSHAQQKLYNCTFHVQEDNIYNASSVQIRLEHALNSSFTNVSISVQTTQLKIMIIDPPDCVNEKLSTVYGMYEWPRSFPQETQVMRCENPPSENTFRLCKLEISMDTTKWAKPDMTNCIPTHSIPDIENVTVTTGNAADVVEMIQILVSVQLSNSSQLSSDELDTVVGKLNEVVDVGIKPDLGANIVTVVADILVSNTNVTQVSSVVLNMTSKMGDTMDFQGVSESITAPSLALSLCNVDSEGFSGLTFGVSSISTNLEPEVFVDQRFVNDHIPDIKASISLPPEVQNYFSQNKDTTRVQFQFYATDRKSVV